jgi:hypothetical protein
MLRNPTFRNGPRSVSHYNRAFHTSILADIPSPYGVWAKGVSFKKVSGAKQEKQKLGNYIRDYIANNDEEGISLPQLLNSKSFTANNERWLLTQRYCHILDKETLERVMALPESVPMILHPIYGNTSV